MILQGSEMFFAQNPVIFAILLAWAIVWKGLALWKAARLGHKKWFIAILILNTIGILDIIYLYFVAKKYTVVAETEEKSATTTSSTL